jgi:hypothetical protein
LCVSRDKPLRLSTLTTLAAQPRQGRQAGQALVEALEPHPTHNAILLRDYHAVRGCEVLCKLSIIADSCAATFHIGQALELPDVDDLIERPDRET